MRRAITALGRDPSESAEMLDWLDAAAAWPACPAPTPEPITPTPLASAIKDSHQTLAYGRGASYYETS